MEENITQLFIDILLQADSVDVAESEFKKMIDEDEELHMAYREWCHEVGYTERSGFIDFCEEYLRERESVWDNLNDFDE